MKAMRDDLHAPIALRWWTTLGRAERIVAMALATGGAVTTACSAMWAGAACFMSYQHARASIARESRLRIEAAQGSEPTREIPGDIE